MKIVKFIKTTFANFPLSLTTGGTTVVVVVDIWSLIGLLKNKMINNVDNGK